MDILTQIWNLKDFLVLQMLISRDNENDNSSLELNNLNSDFWKTWCEILAVLDFTLFSQGFFRLPHEDLDWERCLLGDHCWARNRARRQGKAVLRRLGLRTGNGYRSRFLLSGEILWIARRTGYHYWQRAIPMPRDHVPARLHWKRS